MVLDHYILLLKLYLILQDKKNQKVINASEIEAARQKIQNTNTINFMNAVRQNMR